MLFSGQQVAQRASNNFRGSPQVTKCQSFICTLGMRRQHRARARPVNHAGYASPVGHSAPIVFANNCLLVNRRLAFDAIERGSVERVRPCLQPVKAPSD